MSLWRLFPAAYRTLCGRPRNEELFAGHIVLNADGLGELRDEPRLPCAVLLSVFFALVAVVWFVFFVLALCVVYFHTGPKSPSAIDGAWMLTWVSLVHFFSCALLFYLGVTVEASHEDIHPALNAIVAASICLGGKIAAPDSFPVVVGDPLKEALLSHKDVEHSLRVNHTARNLRVVFVSESKECVAAYAKEHETAYGKFMKAAANRPKALESLEEENKVKAVFEHNNLTKLISNMRAFLGDKALGLSVVEATFSARGVKIGNEEPSIFAADMSIYVFFVCSINGLKDFCERVTKKPDEWPRRQVLLVSPPYTFTRDASPELLDVMSIMTGPAEGSTKGGAVSGIANRVILAVCDSACYLAGAKPRVADAV